MKESMMRLELFMNEDGMPALDIKMKEKFKNYFIKHPIDRFEEDL